MIAFDASLRVRRAAVRMVRRVQHLREHDAGDARRAIAILRAVRRSCAPAKPVERVLREASDSRARRREWRASARTCPSSTRTPSRPDSAPTLAPMLVPSSCRSFEIWSPVRCVVPSVSICATKLAKPGLVRRLVLLRAADEVDRGTRRAAARASPRRRAARRWRASSSSTSERAARGLCPAVGIVAAIERRSTSDCCCAACVPRARSDAAAISDATRGELRANDARSWLDLRGASR